MDTSNKLFYATIFKNINNTANIIIIFLILQFIFQGLMIYYNHQVIVFSFVITLFLIPAIHHIKQISYFYQYYLETGKTIYDK